MKPEEFAAIRARLHLTQRELAIALAYRGHNSAIEISKFETSLRYIPKRVARLMLMFDRFGVPKDFLP